jgi:predicted anti-sigma-YlaC factor YlaD
MTSEKSPLPLADDMSCKELVELVTEYLEGTLPPSERARFDEHLVLCPGCRTYLEQMRLTIRVLGKLSEESIAPRARDELLRAFRNWKRG